MDYSQHGEQAILERLLPEPRGLLIDIGALDGFRNSNTRFLLERGWRGLMIEPNADSHLALRGNTVGFDVACLPVAIWSYDGFSVMFHDDRHPGLSSLRHRGEYGQMVRVPVMSPASLLNLTGVANIDLLSIDAEGCDADIVMAWPVTALPRVLVYEYDKATSEGELHDYLRANGYTKAGRTIGNAIWSR